MAVSEAVLVFLLALLTALATGLGALPFHFARKPTRRWLGLSNAAAAGLMLAASLGLAYEGALRGPVGVLVGAGLGFVFIILVRRLVSIEEHPAVFAGLSGLDARKGLLIVGIMTAHSFTEGRPRGLLRQRDGPGPVHHARHRRTQHPRRAAISLVLVPRGVGAGLAAFGASSPACRSPLWRCRPSPSSKPLAPCPTGSGLRPGR